jgi:hypothetical protein
MSTVTSTLTRQHRFTSSIDGRSTMFGHTLRKKEDGIAERQSFQKLTIYVEDKIRPGQESNPRHSAHKAKDFLMSHVFRPPNTFRDRTSKLSGSTQNSIGTKKNNNLFYSKFIRNQKLNSFTQNSIWLGKFFVLRSFIDKIPSSIHMTPV